MPGLRVCVICFIVAATAVFLQLGPSLEKTLRWSSSTPCEGEGTIPYGPRWKYTEGAQSGVTLTVSGPASEFPEVPDGQYWKADETCYNNIKHIVVNGLAAIGTRAFAGIRGLSSVTGQSVEIIGPYAFDNCEIATMDFPNLMDIGIRAFEYTWGFAEFKIQNSRGLARIQEYAFESSLLRSLDITADRVMLGDGALSNCYRMTEFKGKLTNVPDSCFNGCSGLSVIDLSSVESIGNYAFRAGGVTAYQTTTVTKFIGEHAFEGSVLETITLVDHADSFSIGTAAFKECWQLKSIVVQVPRIPDSCFEKCSVAETVSISSRVEYIGARAFWTVPMGAQECTVDVEGLTYIGSEAFYSSGLKEFLYRNSPEPLAIGDCAFQWCHSLIRFSGENIPNIPKSCFTGCASMQSFSVTSPVENIGESAFLTCASLVHVMGTQERVFATSEATQSIGANAFSRTPLEFVDLTTHAASFTIGSSAFSKCDNLQSFSWSPSYAVMADSLFTECGLVSIVIPATVTEFGDGVFDHCPDLVSVTYLGHALVLGMMFRGCYRLNYVKVPDDYQYDEFGGVSVDRGFSRAAKIGVGVGGSLVVIVIVIIVVLAVTGKIRCRRRSAESESEGETETVET